MKGTKKEPEKWSIRPTAETRAAMKQMQKLTGLTKTGVLNLAVNEALQRRAADKK